jgi:catechol 2,3-dioxygenase-like lactoylglutathione lyase family enzyme
MIDTPRRQDAALRAYRAEWWSNKDMPITLNHTIVPSHDKESSARFFADLFGFEYTGLNGHFAPVQVNDTLTLDWDTREHFEGHHYAFLVNDQEFDAIFGRIKDRGVVYGSGPGTPTDGQINRRLGGRGLYFADPDGHLMEIMTRA